MYNYSDDELIDMIKNLGVKLNKTPTLQDLKNEKDYPHISVFRKRFGTWNDILELAGFKKNKIIKSYTDDELIELLQKLANELGRTPTKRDMNKSKGYPSYATYYYRFGNWNNALQKAGLEINEVLEYTDDELINYLQKLHEKLGKVPTIYDMDNEKGFPYYSAYLRRFDSWENALQKANIEYFKLTKEFLISDLQRFYEENGHIPTAKEINKANGYFTERCYSNHFGTWNNALKETGFKIKYIRNGVYSECFICRSKTKNGKNWHYDEERNLLCEKCYNSMKIRKDIKYKKGELYYKLTTSKGLIGELIVQKVLNIPKNHNFNLEKGFCQPHDLFHKNYGNIDVKFRKRLGNTWSFNFKTINIPDTYIILGFSKDIKIIEHVWTIPHELKKDYTTSFSLNKNDYKMYEIDVSLFNEVYQCMSIENCEYLTKEKE